MKFIAEITLRTVAFDADDADDARRKMGDSYPGFAMVIPPSHVVEIVLFEVEDIDP